jgi:hypothetical protein
VCSIKSCGKRFSLYKPQKSGVTLGKKAICREGLSEFCRNFRYWSGGEYCTVLVQRHVPALGWVFFAMALGRVFRAGFRTIVVRAGVPAQQKGTKRLCPGVRHLAGAQYSPVGASLLAMDVNDNESCLNDEVVRTFFASRLAPTIGLGTFTRIWSAVSPPIASKLAPTV